jgi:hypothetical protein
VPGITSFTSNSSDSSCSYSAGSFTTWRSGRSRLLRVGSYLSGTSSRVVKNFRKYAEAEDEGTFSDAGGASLYSESAPPSFDDTRLLDVRQPGQSITPIQNGDGHLATGQFTGDGLADIDESDSSLLRTVHRGRAHDQRNADRQQLATNTVMEYPMSLHRPNLVESRARELAQANNMSLALEKVTKEDDYRSSSPSSLLVATSFLSAEGPPAPDRFVKARPRKTRFSPPLEVRLDRLAPSVPPVEKGLRGQTEGKKPKKPSSRFPAARTNFAHTLAQDWEQRKLVRALLQSS